MTEPSENTATRPISVAELLAKNGNIGAPAPGGRRRRRRGNADAVTVAELTGEIPIIRLDDTAESAVADAPTVEETPVVPAADEADADETQNEETKADEAAADDVEAEEAEAEEDEEAEAEEADTDEAKNDEARADEAEAAPDEAVTDEVDPLVEPEPAPESAPRRHAHLLKKQHAPHNAAVGAEEMTFDPLLDDVDEHDTDSPYLKSPSDTLFGGDSVADDVARRDTLEDTQRVAIDLDERDEAGTDLDSEPSAFMRGFWIVVQSVLAVALGAGLFIAFDQLWKWNNIVALALSVLVILGLVVGVRVVRKTEDIASTLIAVAVGAMVTLGPLALLQST